MPEDKARKRDVRARMAATGERYTTASRRLGEGLPPEETAATQHEEALRQVTLAREADPPVPAEAIAAAAADPAAGYASDDWSTQARLAREDAVQLRAWEDRRAGRPVRLWEAGIEVRCAATCEPEAWWRLTLYMRHPRYRAPGLDGEPMAHDLRDRDTDAHSEVQLVPAGQLSAGERERLELDYPRRYVLWPEQWSATGPDKDHDITEYACALRLAGLRLAGKMRAGEAQVSRPALPAGVTLQVWRAVYRCRFLAGISAADARIRAAELAATVVTWDGRPAGEFVSLEPDDGFAAPSGWLHPACGGTIDQGTQDALFDDYDAGGSTAVQAAALAREAGELEGSWHRSNAEMDAWEARLHVQPDGSRTLSTPRELEDAATAARLRHGYMTPAQLREAAGHADYMADRVYGKVVETDDDYRRIERSRHEAAILRQLADAREASMAGPDLQPG